MCLLTNFDIFFISFHRGKVFSCGNFLLWGVVYPIEACHYSFQAISFYLNIFEGTHKMKIFAAGVKRQHGVGKESGNPYDMFNMLTLVPVEAGKMGGMSVEGTGFQILDLRIADEATFRLFYGIKFPCIVEIELEPRPFMGKYVTTIVGIVPAVKAA